MTTNKELIVKWDELMIANYGSPSIAISHGTGSYVWDVEGKKYLDLLGGIAVSVLGHSHPKINQAISDQANRLLHSSNLYMNSSSLELAAKLVAQFESTGKVFFCQDGATAKEAALKLARKHGYALKPDGSKQVILAMKNGFHGRTSGALAITGNPEKRDKFSPFGYEVRFVEFNNLDSLNNEFADDVCGLFVEPFQGEGGMNAGATDFLQACEMLCKQFEALLIVDEVQSGVGRTGTFFNYKQHNLHPDIVTLAKGLAGGMPIGAVVATDSAAKNFLPGEHGSTFGGNPVSAAAANSVMDVVTEPKFLSNVIETSSWFVEQIKALNLKQVVNVRHAGHWYGIELLTETATDVTKKAAEAGFLINAVKPNVIRLAPPLDITKSELQTFVDALGNLVE